MKFSDAFFLLQAMVKHINIFIFSDRLTDSIALNLKVSYFIFKDIDTLYHYYNVVIGSLNQ